ncbi:Electron transport complex protein RnfE [uncultured Eubacteriales bacterium]|uniref:Ion-translocating oxidoreductase complex subunit E n=1 Tax=uncultured Eubacteriales bacterium TaxID=172733 RepID=A0A212KH25_9FIRM|nr:Electron transport complex protein RnfE [uncultured Eubacteriales bacterium]
MSENNKLSLVSKGILKENPVLVLVLGTCPTLATTTSVTTALGMGIAAAIVLICSNIFISLLRKIIPDSVRIPSYIVVIAGFVSVVQMLVQAFVPPLYEALGVYLPLIVVNCIILGRAEMFASKNSVVDSALDGLGMGLGFICTLLVMATLREVFGAGSFAGVTIPVLSQYAIPILVKPAGGFFIFGCMIALVAKLTGGKANAECEACPGAQTCGVKEKEA